MVYDFIYEPILKIRSLLFLILLYQMMFLGCEKLELNNACDPRSKSYQDLLLLQALNLEKTKYCLLNPTNSVHNVTNAISVSTPLLGYTLKNGTTDSLTVNLLRQPSANVTIPVSVSDASQASVSTSSLTFLPTDWNQPQRITISGLDNLSYGVNGSFELIFGPSVSTDSFANGLTQRSNPISNRDHRKLIFQSNSSTNGNIGGISGADAICNSDSAKPANSGTYKAMISHTAIRIASVTADAGDGQIDWVLAPNQLYTRPNGFVILTTNSASIYVFGPNFTNSIGTNGNSIWTGLNADWTTVGGCGGNWIDGTGGPFGRYGVANSTSNSSINGGNLACNNTSNLFCVQQ
jgi:hypothetical protein